MLRKHIERIVRFPVTTIMLALIATAFFSYQFKELHMVLDPKALLPQEHPYVKLNNVIETQFGGSRVVLIGVASKDGDIFNPSDIEKIKAINEEVKKLPGILENNVVSIADRKVKYVKAEGDSLEIKGLLEGIEYTHEGMAELKSRVYSNPMFINSLISKDGTVAAIITDFKGGASDWWQKPSQVPSPLTGEGKGEGEGKWPAGGEGGWPGAGGEEKGWEQWYVSDSIIHKKILEIVDKYRDANTEIYVGGLPIALSFLEADSWRMTRYVYPIASVVVMFILYLAFRSIQGMILPIVCAFLSVIWAVGLMGVFKIPLDPWNMMTPILILAVAAGHSVQILKRYYEELEKLPPPLPSPDTQSWGEGKGGGAGGERRDKPSDRSEGLSHEGRWGREASKQAVIVSLTKIGPVMITAGIVAAASFASLITFKLKTFQSFGLFTAFGILSALVLEMTFIPAARSLMRPPKKVAGVTPTPSLPRYPIMGGGGKEGDAYSTPSPSMGEGWGGPLDRLLLSISNLVTHRSWLVWLGLIVVIAVSLYGINRLTIINSLKGLFFESTQFRKDDASLNKYFGGTATFYVYVEGPEPDSLKDPAVLKAIESLQKEIEAVPEVGKTQSYVDYVKAFNQSMHGGDTSYRTIPDSRSTVSEYLFLFSLQGAQGEMGRFLDYQYQKSVIWIFLRDDSTVLGEKLISIVNKYSPPPQPSPIKGEGIKKGGNLQPLPPIEDIRAKEVERGIKKGGNLQPLPSPLGGEGEGSLIPQMVSEIHGPLPSPLAGEGEGGGGIGFPPGIKLGVAGSIPVMMALNQTMVSGKVWNIIQIGIIVFIISSIVLRSPVGGILVLLPLGIAVLINFGVLGLVGIGLGVGTAAISAMAVGFGADYSIYLLYRLREEVRGEKSPPPYPSPIEGEGIKKGGNLQPLPSPLAGEGEGGGDKRSAMDAAIRQTLLTAGKAIIFVALALSAGGVTLLFTGYYLHMEGFLVPLAMLTSSLATLIVLPAVVTLIKPGFIYR